MPGGVEMTEKVRTSYPTLKEVKGKVIWRCCYGDMECVEVWTSSLHPSPDEAHHFVMEICPACEHNRNNRLSPTTAKEESPLDTHNCEFLLEDKGCDLSPKDGCEYTTLDQKCGFLIRHSTPKVNLDGYWSGGRYRPLRPHRQA